MALAYVQSASAAAAATSVTVNKPTGTANGHLMVALICVKASATVNTINVPSGWTAYILPPPVSAAYPQMAVLYKIAGNAEPTSYTFTQGTGAVTGMSGSISTYSGANTQCPFLTGIPAQSAAASTALVTNTVAAHAAKATTAISCSVIAATGAAPTATTWTVRATQAQATNTTAFMSEQTVAVNTATTGSLVAPAAANLANITICLNPDATPIVTRAAIADSGGNTSAAPGASFNIGASAATSQTLCVGALMLALVGWQNDPGATTTPTGWTLLASRAPTGGYPHFFLYSKIATAADLISMGNMGTVAGTSSAFGQYYQLIIVGSPNQSNPAQNVVGADYKGTTVHGWPSTTTVDGVGLVIATQVLNSNTVGTIDASLTQIFQDAEFTSNGVAISAYRQYLGVIGAAPAYTHTGAGAGPDNDNGSDVAFTIAAADTAPTAPTLSSPLSGTFDSNNPQVFNWSAFVDPDIGDTQTSFDFSYQVNGGAFTTVNVSGTASTYTLPGGSVTASGTFGWRVRVYDASGVPSPWSSTTTIGVVTPGSLHRIPALGKVA